MTPLILLAMALNVRAYPQMSVAPVASCSVVTVFAQLVGPEDEKYYCPEIMWEWPNDTRSIVESDCRPFDERVAYPRRWSRRICLPPGDWIVTVRLSKVGKTVIRNRVTVYVR